MIIRTLERFPHGARGLHARDTLIWSRLGIGKAFDENGRRYHHDGYQIWTEHDLPGYESTTPLYQYQCAKSALVGVREYANKPNLDELAADLATQRRPRRKRTIAGLRQRAYREKHRPRNEIPTKLSGSQRAAIIAAVRGGVSTYTVAKQYGVSQSLVWQLSSTGTSAKGDWCRLPR